MASSLWIVAYDIADPVRLRTVARLCEDYGRRMQHSVFLCAGPASVLGTLRDEVRAELEPSADRFLVVPLCPRCTKGIRQLGPNQPLPDEAGAWIV